MSEILDAVELEEIRDEFPILNQRVHGKPLIYLDNAAESFLTADNADAADFSISHPRHPRHPRHQRLKTPPVAPPRLALISVVDCGLRGWG